MHLRLPITLWRHYLLDLLKLVGLSTSILVLVIALGAAVKPLSDGVLQPQDLPKFVMIAVVPMLAYALPFAGGFAATLVFHRVAHENEAIAAHAGGVSHRSLLAPAFLTAILLTGSLLVLTEQIIPIFLREMQRLVSIDVARQIMRGVEKGQAISLKGATMGSVESRLMIYADAARPLTPDPKSGATDEVQLKGFAAVVLSKEGKPIKEVTAQTATLWLYPGGGVALKNGDDDADSRSMVYMRLEHVAAIEAGKGTAGTDETVDFSWAVPDTFREKVSFLTFGELRALKTEPERIGWIDGNRQKVAYTLAERRTIDTIQRQIAHGDAVTFTDSNGKPVTIRAGAISGQPGRWELLPVQGGVITVDMVRGSVRGETPASITAQRALLINEPTSGPHRLDFRLDLEQAKVREASADIASPERVLVSVPGLTPSPNPVTTLLDVPPRELLAQTSVWMGEHPGDDLERAPVEMDKALGRLQNVILAQQNERLALAMSCAVMVLTGAMTALLLSRRLPLTVYLWTFFPAIASMVTISGGQQVTTAEGAPGLILMWSGVGGLALYALIVFRVLAKH